MIPIADAVPFLLCICRAAEMLEMLVCLGVVDEQLAILAVAAWFLARNPDNGPDGFGLVEDCVHFFERAVGCFRVEEVDDGEDEGVTFFHKNVSGLFSCLPGRGDEMRENLHDGKNDVGLISYRLESHGRDHDNHKVKGPVGRGRQRIGRGTNT